MYRMAFLWFSCADINPHTIVAAKVREIFGTGK